MLPRMPFVALSDRERTTLAEIYERDRMIDARCLKCGFAAPIRPEWFWIRNRNFPKETPVAAAMACVYCTPCRPERTQIRWKIVPRTIYADQREPRAQESHRVDWWRDGSGLFDWDPAAMAHTPIVIHTVQQHIDNGYTVSAYCRKCQKNAEVDLHRLVAKGFADRPLPLLKLGCRTCRTRAQLTVRPAKKKRGS
jgi:hypothetical protein